MKILILGGNGFIGSAFAQAALTNGHEVTCLGRNISVAKERLPNCKWLQTDIAKMTNPADWDPHVKEHDVVINAAGALQSSNRDNLKAVQHLAMAAMYKAAAGSSLRIIQISANTSDQGAETEFLATKHAADEALKASGLAYTIFRPTLVVGRNAHGGTALIRSIAAFPLVLPITFGQSKCQVTNLDDLCDLVLEASMGNHGDADDFVVSNQEVLELEKVIIAHRKWLGLPVNRIWRIPNFVAKICSVAADWAGAFGWRSPLRSTALTVLSSGVTSAENIKKMQTRNLAQTLAANSAGVQDLWFARLYLLKPVILLCLILFWITSGAIALWQFDATVSLATVAGIGLQAAKTLSILTSLADIFLGLSLMFQRFAKQAIWGMILLSITYLASGMILQPELWVHPLGPMIKVIPVLVLHVVALSMLDER